MSPAGRVQLDAIWAMLAECAPGHSVTEKPHHYWVRFGGRLYPALPKGSHGRRGPRSRRAEIERGHVRKMVRFLGIDRACADRALPTLRA